MTEIKIEKKKPVWPWILLGVFVIGLILFFLFVDNDREELDTVAETPVEVGVVAPVDLDPIVTSYIVFIENDVDSMGLSHEFTNDAFEKLIEATRNTADRNNFDISADLESAQDFAAVITKEPFETTHAEKIRKAADILTTALVGLQQAKFPDLTNEANEVKSAANSINPATPTLDQKVEVKTFFRETRDLIREMNY